MLNVADYYNKLEFDEFALINFIYCLGLLKSMQRDNLRGGRKNKPNKNADFSLP